MSSNSSINGWQPRKKDEAGSLPASGERRDEVVRKLRLV
jgi:hypothetical protein